MSKIYVVSYANGRFLDSQKILEKQCYKFGADKVLSFGENHIDKDFFDKNHKILSSPRGAGYWLWKQYFINKVLQEVNNDDIVMYVDSGAYPIHDLKSLPMDDPVNCFEVYGHKNKVWTKYDCFYIMNCIGQKYYEPYQILGGFQIYKKNKISESFVKENLEFCQMYQAISDSPSVLGKNDIEFKDHRHDQSIFTNLCIKYDIKPHRDPSQWGNEVADKYQLDNYPQVFNLHRGVL
jgi:hypothetical protein